jgi:cytochrome bd-type quinol oxidase subunit 2
MSTYTAFVDRPSTPPQTRPPRALRAAQLAMIVMAVPMTVGGVIFAVISPDHHHAAWVTWTLAPIAAGTGLGLLLTAPRAGRRNGPRRLTLVRLLALATTFSVVKLAIFHEGASVPFLVLGVAALALLATRPVRAFFDVRCTDIHRKS